MKFRRLLLPAVLAFPVLCPAASKEIVELQRDVAQLQDQVRNLQRSFDERMAAMQVLVQQAADSASKASNSVAGLQGAIQEQLRQQGKEVVAPIANTGAKVDQMTTEFTEVRNSMADVTARLGKLEQQIIDLSNAVRTMQTPAAPPPGSTSPTGSGPTASNSPPPISGDVLYSNANRDRLGGKADLALQEYSDFVKYYSDSSLAPAAQFWIGDIHFSQGEFDKALSAFDMVLEKYPANNKTPDALYMKGRSLLKLDRRMDGAKEFHEVIRRYPSSDAATKAKAQLRSLGLSASSSASRKRR